MTEIVLALIPDYGLFVIFGVIFVACLAVPLPSSMVVLASGGFAATEDLALLEVLPVAFAAYALGDQAAFWLSRSVGPPLLDWLRKRRKPARIIAKGEELVETRGVLAVILSHTLLSPLCPYVSFICGAGRMGWVRFTAAAVAGAALWTAAYVSLGYLFASQIDQVATILGNLIGLIVAMIGLYVSWKFLRRRWRKAVHSVELAAT